MKRLTAVLIFCVVLGASGCVPLTIGGLGALGGYAISPDTVQGVTDHNPKDVWDSAVEIISIMGLIEEQSEAGGILIARVMGTKVTITVTELTSKTTQLTVKARKAFLPKIRLAQDVFVKIMSNVD